VRRRARRSFGPPAFAAHVAALDGEQRAAATCRRVIERAAAVSTARREAMPEEVLG
jgi:hypothetical protein